MHKSFHFLFSLAGAIFFFIFSVVSTPKHSFALSSATQQLSSNLFVNIAKKLNPAVVNVSTKSKIEKTHRNFRPPGGGRPGPGQGRSPDSFRDFYDKFFGEQRPNQKPKSGMGSGFVIDKEGLSLIHI